MIALIVAATASPTDLSKIHTCGRFFCDAEGRVRIFHGFNDVQEAKDRGSFDGSNYLPNLLSNPSVVAQLSEWGFNVMRMPMMWAAIQPSADEISSAYLSAIRNVTESMALHGVYSFLDMHQDVLSTRFGSYDGAPRWVVNKTQPRHPYPWPLKLPLSQWGVGYLSEATGQGFQDIYRNTHGGRDAWAAAWKAAATHFKGDAAILGYELLNEPFAGDIYHDPLLLLPGVAGKQNLLPAYDAVAEAIRQSDDETIIMFEPLTWGMIFPTKAGELPKIAASGFDHCPGGNAYANRSAFAYHYYCWFAQGISEQKSSSGPYAPLQKLECDRLFGPLVFESVDQTVATLGSASIMTEFGGMAPNSSNPSSLGFEEVEWVLNEADRRFQSWTFWDIGALYGPAPTPGGARVPRLELLQSFVRPYARAIAGTPTTTSFDYATNRYTLAFEPSNTSAPTEIVLPALRYPHGTTVTTSPDTLRCATCPADRAASAALTRDLLCCTAPPGTTGVATVTVTPKLAPGPGGL